MRPGKKTNPFVRLGFKKEKPMSTYSDSNTKIKEKGKVVGVLWMYGAATWILFVGLFNNWKVAQSDVKTALFVTHWKGKFGMKWSMRKIKCLTQFW